jgi:sphingolipid delta-4 desaturase
MFALHPIAPRFVQERHVVSGNQETYSHYGPLNALSLNLGYHNEHHDFPFVPWNRLPEVTAAASEVYGALHAHRSWSGLWLRFLRDRGLNLYSRVVRRGKSPGPLRPLDEGA